MVRALAIGAGLVLWWLVALLFEHLLYGALMVQLKRQFGIEEGNIVALVATNLIPIAATALIIVFIYWLAVLEVQSREQHASAATIGKGTPKTKVTRQRQANKIAIAKKIESQKQIWRDARNFAFLGALIVGLLVSGWSMVNAINRRSALMSITMAIPTINNAPDTFGINIFAKNIGTAPAVAMRHSYVFISSPSINVPASVMDAASNKITDQLKLSRKFNITTELQVAGAEYYTAVARMQDYVDNKNGSRFLFLLSDMEYRDKFLPLNKFRVTELCLRINPNNSMAICGTHNTTFERE